MQSFVVDPSPPPTQVKLFMQSATGHFSSTIRQDTFAVYADYGGCLNVVITTVIGPTIGGGTVEDFTYTWCAYNSSGSVAPIRIYSQMRLAVGDYDEDNYDEVVIAWLDGNNNLHVSPLLLL